jgi:hypothetical protein
MNRDQCLAAMFDNPVNRTILQRLPAIGVADAWLVSGALFQTAWNVRTGRAAQYGIKDYDIFYFDPDTSYEAEDAVIRKARALFADVKADIEVRNQARVHLWYEEKFGAHYPPLTRSTDGIDRFLMHAAQIGVRRSGTGFSIYAPHGLDDIAQMVVRPNRTANFSAALYWKKAERWKALWPEMTIRPA